MFVSVYVPEEIWDVLKANLDSEVQGRTLNGEQISRNKLILEALQEKYGGGKGTVIDVPEVIETKAVLIKIPKRYRWFAHHLRKIVKLKKEQGVKSSIPFEILTLAVLSFLGDTSYADSLRSMLNVSSGTDK